MSNNVASFVISLDTELAWGRIDRPRPDPRQAQYEQTREVVSRLLEMFEKYEVSGTWAIVGHLFLESCTQDGSTAHPDVVRPQYAWKDDDWFANDPRTDLTSDPTWYAPDIVRQVLDCPVHQEVGSHSFSHMIIGDQGCSREAFATELDAFDVAAAKFDVHARSFVFPRNVVGHVDVLAEHGYAAYRGESAAWFSRLPAKFQKLARMVDAFLPFAGATSQPVKRSGIWDIPASYLYLHRSGWARWVPMRFRVQKAIGAMRKAAREESTFHMWFHPFNLASDPDNLLAGMQAILEEFRCLKESALIESRTMSEVAASLDRASAELESPVTATAAVL